MKILVLQHKKIGDVLLSSIICNNLRNLIPHAEIHYLINKEAFPVVQGNPSIDRVITLNPEHRASARTFIKLILQIRREHYDVVIDAYTKLESWLIVMFCAAKRRISYKKKYRTFLYTDNLSREAVKVTQHGRIIDLKLLLIQPFLNGTLLERHPQIHLAEEEKLQAAVLFKTYRIPNRKNLMLNVIGSCPLKTYPLEYMATLINEITARVDVNILFNFLPHQKEDAQKLYTLCNPLARKNIFLELANYDLRMFIAIMSQCDAIIGNEGGAIHIAKAFNKPSFTIFSPWITKQEWSTFEDGVHHVAVHLSDFKTDLYENTPETEFKEKALELFRELKPEFILPKLNIYLTRHFGGEMP
ncbi:glycosyltransferase family 9 protein [Fluoribacter dumoffii]|uniref:ADP-heptose--LPS heptosyltransferase 2 n=1 Tax=Fluoribacter dumoffii TaxID=463 RepID=A0A377GDE7_9GAMM|nr:glycosyltransferase family 9 protein [Fluoribacter dumoffii]KTC91162.1 heptosyl transferase, glycosyltransferase family 9 protein [Fluoribacter dumoffii NY 23]MCW8387670.1 glycosyltransferase family 9 protein [Fluoribacter dumoffii]MCW8497873.1 glycosyltransferase family 9 protein [Fluoribacter dumoffii]STO22857.1 ADP-heptose--LPS heptosyltransferase 2 [Fluoribacter dumoffii]